MVRTENFHRLHDMLSQLKVEALQAYQAQAKDLYVVNMAGYVKEILGRPMEKLSTLFEGSSAVHVRAAPLVRAKAKITVRNAVCCRLAHTAFFTGEFGFDSHEWSCSKPVGN